MRKRDCKVFNLNEKRPQVLLLGNGLTYGTGLPWYKLIQQVARVDVDVHQYERKNKEGKVVGFHVPNTVLTMATSETDDTRRHNKYGQAFENADYTPNKWLKKLLEMPFDAVLTTNYTCELETALLSEYQTFKPEKKRKYAYQTGNVSDAKYLIHTFNRIWDNNPDIWHIHGELRRPSSIILSHDEYARLICRILNYNEDRGRKYDKDREGLAFESWIDYFLLGNVYTLGLSFDFSDIDLWWLLGRRLREKTGKGIFIFYEPEKEGNYYKHLALSDSGVDVRTCGITIRKNDEYDCFYEMAIHNIEKQLRKQR